jgi:hypothetical protein
MSTKRAGRRSGVVLAVTAVCGAAAIASAPAAAAAPDPGSGGCPSGYLATSADGTYVGVAAALPGSTADRGNGRPGVTSGRSTSAAPRHGELVGTGCFRHTGDTATMRFSWSSVGPVLSGTFVYQLFDCTTGQTANALTRRLGYETPTGTSGSAGATVAVDPAHTYRMRITGDGAYSRDSDGFSGLAGYWSTRPPAGSPKWLGQTPCA